MKIGIYAGTFDPIHTGHCAFAEAAIESTQLDRVIIVAEKKPYRKAPFTSWDHRQAMIERATEHVAAVDHDYQLASKLAHKHTMPDMLTIAQQHYGSEHAFWFLVGSDVFEHIHMWEGLTSAPTYGGFVIALRDGHTREWLKAHLQALSRKGITMTTSVIDSPQPHISSSAIRRDVAGGVEVTNLTAPVQDYILDHNLYHL